jgi:hypothetical protein
MLKYLGKAFRAVFAQHLVKSAGLVPAGTRLNSKWKKIRFLDEPVWTAFSLDSSSTNAIFKKSLFKKFLLAE